MPGRACGTIRIWEEASGAVELNLLDSYCAPQSKKRHKLGTKQHLQTSSITSLSLVDIATGTGNMATPKYRFIPLAYMQEVAERLSSETPVQTPSSKDIYRYRLRELSEEVRQLVLKEVVSKSAKLYPNCSLTDSQGQRH